MERLERRSLDDITSFLGARQITIALHTEAPIDTTSAPRRGGWFADLVNPAGDTVAPHYGFGPTEEAAIRAAARRWRIEQIGHGHQRRPDEPLP